MTEPQLKRRKFLMALRLFLTMKLQKLKHIRLLTIRLLVTLPSSMQLLYNLNKKKNKFSASKKCLQNQKWNYFLKRCRTLLAMTVCTCVIIRIVVSMTSKTSVDSPNKQDIPSTSSMIAQQRSMNQIKSSCHFFAWMKLLKQNVQIQLHH